METKKIIGKCFNPNCELGKNQTPQEVELDSEGQAFCKNPECKMLLDIPSQKRLPIKKIVLISSIALIIGFLGWGGYVLFSGKNKIKATTDMINGVKTVKSVVDSSKIGPTVNAALETVQQLIKDGDLMLSTKDYEKAKQFYQKILTLDPGNDHAKNQLIVIENIISMPPPAAKETKTSGSASGKINKTLNFSFGYYKGETLNGLRDGQGTMFFTERYLISPKDLKKRYAEAGDYVSGTWVEGNVVNGKLFNKAGEQKEALLIGY
jgi:hypothetical protein